MPKIGNTDRLHLLVKELQMIQDIIKRMALNSFLIKGWTISLVAVTLLFKGEANGVTLLALTSLCLFWGLDAYYLRQERLFRELHAWVAENRPNSDEHLFDMKTDRVKEKVCSWSCHLFSKTIAPFYLLILVMIFIYWASKSNFFTIAGGGNG